MVDYDISLDATQERIKSLGSYTSEEIDGNVTSQASGDRGDHVQHDVDRLIE